jgi:hypothetical protein
VTATPEETLAEEHRRRKPAAVAAIAAGILSLLGLLLSVAASTHFPAVQFVRSLQEHLRGTPPKVALKAKEVLYLNDHPFLQIGILQMLGAAVITAATAIGAAYALGYLYRATLARKPDAGRLPIIVIITGAVLVAVPGLVSAVAVTIDANSFADASSQSSAAARDVFEGSVATAGAFMSKFGGLVLGLGFVLISLKAMSVGLLTRFMGVLGIIVGAVSVIQAGPLPFVEMLWLIGLGLLFLHRWPGGQGVPPAWESGESEPWPSQQELREARLARTAARTGAREERKEQRSGSSNGKTSGKPSGKSRANVPETPAPEVPARPAHSSSKKKKRKRR